MPINTAVQNSDQCPLTQQYKIQYSSQCPLTQQYKIQNSSQCPLTQQYKIQNSSQCPLCCCVTFWSEECKVEQEENQHTHKNVLIKSDHSNLGKLDLQSQQRYGQLLWQQECLQRFVQNPQRISFQSLDTKTGKVVFHHHSAP